MKKTLFIALITALISPTIHAQITLEHTFNGGSHAELINLESSGEKIVVWNNTTITLYNPDYTLWKSFSIPQYQGYTVYFFDPVSHLLSESLFDTDPNTIEYLVVYQPSNGNNNVSEKTEILREDGTLLEQFDGLPRWDEIPEIFKGADGKVKLPISKNDGSVEIYSLPGTFPCQPTFCDDNSSSTGMKPVSFEQSGGMLSNAVPNPSATNVQITYILPHSASTAFLYVSNTSGKLIYKQLLKNQRNTITLDLTNVPAGVYYYQIKTARGASSAKKLVVVK